MARFRASTVSRRGLGLLRQVIRLLVRRILVRAHIRAKCLHRVGDQRRRISVTPHKFCRRPERQIQNVVKHQHLPVAVGTGSDADRRRADLPP